LFQCHLLNRVLAGKNHSIDGGLKHFFPV
jgi:hypothetical protein